MKPDYINAVEQRMAWLKWALSLGGQWHGAVEHGLEYKRIFDTYTNILASSETFYMSAPFARLVDHARRETPGNLPFDARWMQANRGWMWIEEPFVVPETELTTRFRDMKAHFGNNLETYTSATEDDWLSVQIKIRAVGWRSVAGLLMAGASVAPPNSFQFCFYMDPAVSGPVGAQQRGNWNWLFSPWSFFVIKDGDSLDARMEEFEVAGRVKEPDGAYVSGATKCRLHTEGCGVSGHVPFVDHEMRWAYTAFHLMAQRLAIEVPQKPDRAMRRRAEREGRPEPPVLRVITLRRLEEDRAKDPQGDEVDWQWQWEVRSHWRQQWYPSEGIHKPVLIDAYIKGPEDKPLKPSSHKLFVAAR